VGAVYASPDGVTVAPTSAWGWVNVPGAQVDIVAPGVDVLTARKYATDFPTTIYASGTSIAAPFAAGLAALHVEADGKTGEELWMLMTTHTGAVTGPARKRGHGMLMAPSGALP